ncbi:TPA: hypothetical protein ACPPHQ_000083 [Haemophilus influenzae]|uniref:DUF7675 family protein n=1 Tax=Haemophilus influenzae TaxID=727 RepID=UPI000E5709CD|nr:hypothetical protein [Haemophilus influenzae]
MILWYKNEDTDKVWWKSDRDTVGAFVFSFDKKTEFNFWQDYPHKLTAEQKAIFDAENEILVRELKG